MVHENSLKNLQKIQPGEVKNPNGRPKGSKNLTTLIKKALDQRIKYEDKFTKKRRKKTAREHVVLALIAKAMDGDVQAAKVLLERLEGKVEQPIRASGEFEHTHLIKDVIRRSRELALEEYNEN